MSSTLRRRLRAGLPTFLLGAVVYIPLLLTAPGKVGADTKTYLYLDPGRMLSRAVSMWDPNIGMGTVTHQNIGYLWPIGPYYWLAQAAGLPDWVAQRIWLGSIMFLAGLGVRYLLNTLGQRGPQVTAASFMYALTPYVLTLAARISVILLPFAGLPWLIAFTVLALRRGGWRYPALFALTIATIGSVNATALVLTGVGPFLWILHELVVTRDVRWRQAAAAVGRIGVLTIVTSLWWMSGLYAQSAYGIDILRYTETAKTVAAASLAPEVLRGLGYWFFYGEDRYGPWIAPSKMYTQRIWLLVVSYLLPTLALLGAAVARFRDRAFFAALLLAGTFLSVGGHPWGDPPPAGRAVKSFLLSDTGLAMRSLPRAAPLVVLAMSVFLGSGLAALAAERQRWARPAAAIAVALAVLGLPPLWTGKIVDKNLDREETIPAYWQRDARYLDARGHDTRVLELPGADFASYRWGTTVDPITPGLMDRPFVARELIPYGSPPSADVLNALDRQLQEGVLDQRALAPMSRFMSVGDINLRSDLTYERYNTPRPRLLWNFLRDAPGLGVAAGFGGNARNVPRPSLPLRDEIELQTPPSYPDPPRVAVLPVRDAEKIVRLAPTEHPVVLDGDGEGMVDAAAAGLLSGHELVLYSASFAGRPAALRQQVGRDAALVITDTNRRRARRWSTVRDNLGETERPGQKALQSDPGDQRLELFPDAGGDAATVTESRGGAWAESTSFGNSISLTPEDRAANAVDGDTGTAWREGGFDKAIGERLRIHYRSPVTTDHIRFLQPLGGVRNRFITQIAVRFDGGKTTTFPLDASSHDPPGQNVSLGETRTFRTLEVQVTATDLGRRTRYDGISPVGFAEVDVTPDRPDGSRTDDLIRLPEDLLGTTGAASLRNPLAVVLTRDRTPGILALRGDSERSFQRAFTLPTARDFAFSGDARLSNTATDDVLDRALDMPDAARGGVTATSKRRIPGGLDARSSAAIDGDPETWYSPGFLGQNDEHLRYQLARPISFDHLDLTVLNDGRHSVPRRLRIEADGKVVATVQVPSVPDQRTPNGRTTIHLRFPKVTGQLLTFAVDVPADSVREVKTIDWYTAKPIVMPIGIVELGVPGLRVDPPKGRIDPRCRSGLLQVDGRDVAVSLQGTVADLLDNRPVQVRACEDSPLRLPAGERVLRATRGGLSGFDFDRLVLRSAPGGAADRADGPLSPNAQPGRDRPAMRVTHAGRTSIDLEVPRADHRFWVVLGQSHNLGWKATANGRDLGQPMLVNGYANGWQVPAGSRPIRIHLEWTPQKVVRVALGLSALGVALCLALVIWPWRRRRPAVADSDHGAFDADPGMPVPLRLSRVLRYTGLRPSVVTTVATVLLTLVVFGAVIGPLPGLILAVVAAAALGDARVRPLLTIGSPAVLGLSAAYILVKQIVSQLPAGFDWPGFFEPVHQVAWGAVALLVLDVLIDRLWQRRWWPMDDTAP